jgi:alpha-tubulin suppressor-like RCC1 family protein
LVVQERNRKKREQTREETKLPWKPQESEVIAAGQYHTCAVKADSTVACWGGNDYGQATPPPDLGPVQSLAANCHHNCAVKADATVACWGDDDRGQATPPEGLLVTSRGQK